MGMFVIKQRMILILSNELYSKTRTQKQPLIDKTNRRDLMKESALIIYMADMESLEATTGFVRKLKDDGNFNVDFVTFEQRKNISKKYDVIYIEDRIKNMFLISSIEPSDVFGKYTNNNSDYSVNIHSFKFDSKQENFVIESAK